MEQQFSYAENELIDRLLAGDQNAWRGLVEEYSAMLLGACRNTFGSYGFESNSQDREDVVAEVWKCVLANDFALLRKCRVNGNLPQTLFLVTRRRTVDWIRAHRKGALPLAENDPAPEPPAGHFREDQISALKAALKCLTPREEAVVKLFFIQKKKYRDIAALTGIPLNSIGPTLGRALARLRSRFASSCRPS